MFPLIKLLDNNFLNFTKYRTIRECIINIRIILKINRSIVNTIAIKKNTRDSITRFNLFDIRGMRLGLLPLHL